MQTTPGQRAALELELQDAIRDLQRLTQERGELFTSADVFFAIACEPGQATVANNLKATQLRLQAFMKSGEIGDLELRIKRLNSQLKAEPARVTPIVLTAEQCAAVDDTIGALA